MYYISDSNMYLSPPSSSFTSTFHMKCISLIFVLVTYPLSDYHVRSLCLPSNRISISYQIIWMVVSVFFFRSCLLFNVVLSLSDPPCSSLSFHCHYFLILIHPLFNIYTFFFLILHVLLTFWIPSSLSKSSSQTH